MSAKVADALSGIADAVTESRYLLPENTDTGAVRLAEYAVLALSRKAATMTAGELHRLFGAPGDWGYDTALGAALSEAYATEDVRAPFLVAVTYAQLFGDLFPGAEIMLQVDAEVLDHAAGKPGTEEHTCGSTRTVTVEVNDAVLVFSNREPEDGTPEAAAKALARQRQQRADYLAMGPMADDAHLFELKTEGIMAAWSETRREVTRERASGSRVDRIERIAEALESTSLHRDQGALDWLNSARVTAEELCAAVHLAQATTWPMDRHLIVWRSINDTLAANGLQPSGTTPDLVSVRFSFRH